MMLLYGPEAWICWGRLWRHYSYFESAHEFAARSFPSATRHSRHLSPSWLRTRTQVLSWCWAILRSLNHVWFLCLLSAGLFMLGLRNRIAVQLHQPIANSINIKMGFNILTGIVLPFMPLLRVVNNPLNLIGNSSGISIFN